MTSPALEAIQKLIDEQAKIGLDPLTDRTGVTLTLIKVEALERAYEVVEAVEEA